MWSTESSGATIHDRKKLDASSTELLRISVSSIEDATDFGRCYSTEGTFQFGERLGLLRQLDADSELFLHA